MESLDGMAFVSDAEEQRVRRALDNPAINKLAKAKYAEAIAIEHAQQASGAKLVADKLLRYFHLDYMNRFRAASMHGMPSSFQLGEAFFERRSGHYGLFLLPEKDYVFSFGDFLDFVTSSAAPEVAVSGGAQFVEDFIYNFNSSDIAGDLLLETSATSAYGFRAASVVRRGDDLVVMMSLAEQLPAEALERKLKASAMAEHYPRPGREGLLSLPFDGEVRPVYVEDTGLLATIAIVRFDVRRGIVVARCLLRDLGKLFDVKLDVLEAFGSTKPDSDSFARMVDELDSYDAVWEVAKTLTLMPAYLAARVSVTSQANRPTEFGEQLKSSLKARRAFSPLKAPDRILYRTISAVTVQRAAPRNSLIGRSYTPPSFQVPVDGFWRTLRIPGAMGRDESGKPILGKTWVTAHLRHRDKARPTELPKTVWVKASLSAARRRLEEFRRRMVNCADPVPVAVDAELPPGPAIENAREEEPRYGAYVYIMRCDAHLADLYKVGFTDRDPETRARELSSTTAAPQPFAVVQAWPVSNGMAAEQAAHEALKEVRLSKNREFFQAEYATLSVVVELAVAPWVLSA